MGSWTKQECPAIEGDKKKKPSGLDYPLVMGPRSKGFSTLFQSIFFRKIQRAIHGSQLDLFAQEVLAGALFLKKSCG